MARKFGFATEEQLNIFESMIEAENGQLQEKEFTKATWKKHMAQISGYIEDQTGIGEDEADAILLGRAYFAAKKQGKV